MLTPTGHPIVQAASGISWVESAGGESCYHLYVVLSEERDRLAERLAAAEIGARPYYTVPLHRQPGLRDFHPVTPLPGVEAAA